MKLTTITADHLVAAIGSLMPVESPVSRGVELIADERKRQVEAEGWTPEHDDKYSSNELIRAGGCYANAPYSWPWSAEWWKPSDDPIRNLVKAGALIAAEIDRLLRLEAKKTTANAPTPE